MNQNLKTRRPTKAGYRHIPKVVKHIMENMLQKICDLVTVTSNSSFVYTCSFGLSSWRLCSRVDFFCFHYDPISEHKIWLGNRENMQDLFQRILDPINGPKSSILNWVSYLNIKNGFFPLFKILSFLLLSSITGKIQI